MTDRHVVRCQTSPSPQRQISRFHYGLPEFLVLLVDFCSRTRGRVVRLFYMKPCHTVNLFILVRFWGWSENEREAARDLAELRERAKQGLPLYGESDQPEWVQQAAYSNSAWSQLKFREFSYPILWNAHSSLIACRGIPYVRSQPASP